MRKDNKHYLIIFVLFFLILFFFPKSFANESKKFLSLKNNEVNLRQGPSLEYPVKFIYKKKYLPIKIIDSKDNFKKIIDIKNNDGWIHVSQLTKKKFAINISNLSVAFKKPNIYSRPLAKLEKGKMVNIKKCRDEWCKILVQNNQFWIQKKFLWGKF